MLRLVAKVLLLSILLGGTLLLLRSHDDLSDIPLLSYKLAEVERLEPSTLFVGSSRTYRHVDAVRFDSLQGDGTSYNLGVKGATALEIHHLAERLLETPHVETLVVEIRAIEDQVRTNEWKTRRGSYHHDLRRARLGAEVALASDQPLRQRWTVALRRLALALKHYSLVGQGEALFAAPRHGWEPLPPLDERGFSPLDRELRRIRRHRHVLSTEAEREVFAERILNELRGRARSLQKASKRADLRERIAQLRARDARQPEPLDVVTAEAWAALFRQAAAQAVEVYFVEQVGEAWSVGVTHALRERLPPGRLIVLNDPVRHTEIFDTELWFDKGHVTSEGARWITAALAERIP